MFWLNNGHFSDILDIHAGVSLPENLRLRRYSRSIWRGLGNFGDYLAKMPKSILENSK